MSGLDFVLAGFAAIAAGTINALAGGDTLVTFPLLLAIGVPPVAAEVTNTVALCPGFMGGIMAQIKDLSAVFSHDCGQSRNSDRCVQLY